EDPPAHMEEVDPLRLHVYGVTPRERVWDGWLHDACDGARKSPGRSSRRRRTRRWGRGRGFYSSNPSEPTAGEAVMSVPESLAGSVQSSGMCSLRVDRR